MASSPISTGGGGTSFEVQVRAHFLAQLLIGAVPPILGDRRVRRVSFQTEVDGWATDDILVEARSGGESASAKLAVQVKRTFSVAASDAEFRKTVAAFWSDFLDGPFDAERDHFAVAVLRGTDTLLTDFNNLLDIARGSCDGRQFAARVSTPRLVSGAARRQLAAVLKAVNGSAGGVLGVSNVWPMLRRVHVLSLDFAANTSSTGAMTRSLLAQSIGGGGADDVTAVWNELTRIADAAGPIAGSFEYEDLPQTLRERCGRISGVEDAALEVLRQHSAPTIAGIRRRAGTTPGFTLDRPTPVGEVLDAAGEAGVVLVEGDAGVGKSAVAREAAEVLGDSASVVAFAAEEFRKAHFAEVLTAAGFAGGIAAFARLFGTRSKLFLLVDGVERLLESDSRGALGGLARLAGEHPHWTILLTCRRYSAGLVRRVFLREVEHRVVTVAALTDEELDAAANAAPALSAPLHDCRLRSLLRTPFLLDVAAELDWSDPTRFPATAADLRRKVWSEQIRRDADAADSMPARRGALFRDVAVRRARRLTPFVEVNLDRPGEARVADVLVAEGVLERRGDAHARPSHDVLEDWALLTWIEDVWAVAGGDLADFADRLGTAPAVRRALRFWVQELDSADGSAAAELFKTVLSADAPPIWFRDDVLVASLRSGVGTGVLACEQVAADLMASHLDLLIRLLRVGCARPHDFLGGGPAPNSVLTVPEGGGWEAILKVLDRRQDVLTDLKPELLTGLLEDWSKSVSASEPHPPGESEAAALIFRLLPRVDGYARGDEDRRRRLLSVLARIPTGDPVRFRELLGRLRVERRDVLAETLREIVLDGPGGFAACREMPDAVTTAFRDEVLLKPEDRPRYGFSSLDKAQPFGLRDHVYDHALASALRGPFLSLLTQHPDLGLRFLLDLMNDCVTAFISGPHSEAWGQPFQITLRLPDDREVIQWADDRFWKLYRGTSVAPCVLKAAVMALERWLLNRPERTEDDLDSLLLDLIARSNSVAVTAVAAGVATAHPDRAAKTVLTLLEWPVVRLDVDRHSAERLPPSRYPFASIGRGVEEELDLSERKTADALQHRKEDLRHAVLRVQAGPFRNECWAKLDAHHAAVPTMAGSSVERDQWAAALHGMDLRRWEQRGMERDEVTGRRAIHVGPRPLPPELAERVAENEAEVNKELTGPLTRLWADKALGRSGDGTELPEGWRDRLSKARDGDSAEGQAKSTRRSIAAVCVGCCWERLSDEEKAWCVDQLHDAVADGADERDAVTLMMSAGGDAGRQAARVLPSVLGTAAPDTLRARAEQALLLALHPPRCSGATCCSSRSSGEFVGRARGRRPDGDWGDDRVRDRLPGGVGERTGGTGVEDSSPSSCPAGSFVPWGQRAGSARLGSMHERGGRSGTLPRVAKITGPPS